MNQKGTRPHHRSRMSSICRLSVLRRRGCCVGRRRRIEPERYSVDLQLPGWLALFQPHELTVLARQAACMTCRAIGRQRVNKVLVGGAGWQGTWLCKSSRLLLSWDRVNSAQLAMASSVFVWGTQSMS